jgi:hypothetical protein
VTKPGGRVVASDIDGGTMFLNSANTSLAEAVALRITHGLAQGWMGRRQQRYLVEAGLVDVRVVPTVIMNSVAFTRIVCGGLLATMIEEGATSTDEVDAFWAELEQGERDGWLCSGVACFTVVGTKSRQLAATGGPADQVAAAGSGPAGHQIHAGGAAVGDGVEQDW